MLIPEEIYIRFDKASPGSVKGASISYYDDVKEKVVGPANITVDEDGGLWGFLDEGRAKFLVEVTALQTELDQLREIVGGRTALEG